MLVGNDNYIARIIWPPTGRDKSGYQFVLVNNILLAIIFAFASLNEQAERADIIFWFVIKHTRQPFFITGIKALTFLFDTPTVKSIRFL